MITIAGVGIFVLVLAICYRGSKTAQLRASVRTIVQDFESTSQAQKNLAEEAQKNVQATAAAYLNEVRAALLQSISIDEVKRITSGARLQPLRDRGLTNLLLCQGWDASRLMTLRGIGPDSASKIAYAVAELTKTVNRQAIPHPRIKDSTAAGLKLFRELYVFAEVHNRLRGQDQVFEEILKDLRARWGEIEKRTGFFSWLFGSQTKGPLKAALEAGQAIAAEVKPSERYGGSLADGKARAAEVSALVRSSIAVPTLWEHASTNPEYYRANFERLLGPDAGGTQAPQPAAPSVVLTRAQTPVTTPAAVPVRVKTGRDARSGFSISVTFDASAPPPVVGNSAGSTGDWWVPADQPISVGAFKIEGGLIYVGKKLLSINGATTEPALIDPSLPISIDEAACTTRMLNYWPSYSYATPAARASYLQWLTTGRNNPAADIAYVFIYFYGLERRALFDSFHDSSARGEISTILTEVRRLRTIYGSNGSFARYSGEFLDYIEASASAANTSGLGEPPPLKQYHLSFGLRYKLGQLASSRQPLPADWAYAWYYNDPRTRLSAAAFRCPEQMAALFKSEYARQFGEGLVLPSGKTRLKLTYRPASASFGTMLSQTVDLPDVSVLTSSYSKLENIGTECFRQLDTYSRYLGRNKTSANSLEGLLLLPPALWPDAKKKALEKIQTYAQQNRVQTFAELLSLVGHSEPMSRSLYVGFCRSLGASGVGLEPDPRFGSDVPDLSEPVALFMSDASDDPGSHFGVAALLLRLASVVAASDGDFSDAEAERLESEIEGNTQLPRQEKARLLARMAAYRGKAPVLTGLKPTITNLTENERRRITDFLIAMVYADRKVEPSEVKVMEKIYTMFGLEIGALYSRLHELAAGANPVSTDAKQKAGPIQLDAAKVQKLRAASEEITKRLNVIFNESGNEEPSSPKEIEPAETGVNPRSSLLDLDPAHTDLLVVLIVRAEWTRSEFEEVCSDKGLMPDGAIERINDAAFTKFDQALIEGDDPLEIAIKLIEENLYAGENSPKGS